jgi:hypothetical protein
MGNGWAAAAEDAARRAEEEQGGARSEEHDDGSSSSEDESDALGNVASASSHANSPQSAEDRKDAETARNQFLLGDEWGNSCGRWPVWPGVALVEHCE